MKIIKILEFHMRIKNHAILKVHERIKKITKIIEFQIGIMKIMKILEFHARITKVMKINKNQIENHENYENLIIPTVNHEIHEHLEIVRQNHKTKK